MGNCKKNTPVNRNGDAVISKNDSWFYEDWSDSDAVQNPKR